MERINHNDYSGGRKEELCIFKYDGKTLLEVVDICTAPYFGETLVIDDIRYTVVRTTIDPVALTVVYDLLKA
ncbi:MAG: hypothetical protein U9Q21_03285 [Candidatus Auribacterota bacterium]|nr:hypothetical protein [Candidatus Auribacterota bacterium]